MEGMFDRSRFMDREIMDPMRVMEGASGMQGASSAAAQVGQHTEGNLDFLKQAVDLGVRAAAPVLCARARAAFPPRAGRLTAPSPRYSGNQTSIMAVAYEGGVIVGADSRTSTGAYIANRVSDKVTAVDDSIFVCRSGSAADTQAISDYVTYFLDQHRMELGKPPKVLTAANLFRELCYHNKNGLMAGIIVAGWDQHKGGQVFSIPMGGAMLERPFAIGGARESCAPYHPSQRAVHSITPPPLAPSSWFVLPSLHPRTSSSQALARRTSMASATRTTSRA